MFILVTVRKGDGTRFISTAGNSIPAFDTPREAKDHFESQYGEDNSHLGYEVHELKTEVIAQG